MRQGGRNYDSSNAKMPHRYLCVLWPLGARSSKTLFEAHPLRVKGIGFSDIDAKWISSGFFDFPWGVADWVRLWFSIARQIDRKTYNRWTDEWAGYFFSCPKTTATHGPTGWGICPIKPFKLRQSYQTSVWFLWKVSSFSTSLPILDDIQVDRTSTTGECVVDSNFTIVLCFESPSCVCTYERLPFRPITCMSASGHHHPGIVTHRVGWVQSKVGRSLVGPGERIKTITVHLLVKLNMPEGKIKDSKCCCLTRTFNLYPERERGRIFYLPPPLTLLADVSSPCSCRVALLNGGVLKDGWCTKVILHEIT